MPILRKRMGVQGHLEEEDHRASSRQGWEGIRSWALATWPRVLAGRPHSGHSLERHAGALSSGQKTPLGPRLFWGLGVGRMGPGLGVELSRIWLAGCGVRDC